MIQPNSTSAFLAAFSAFLILMLASEIARAEVPAQATWSHTMIASTASVSSSVPNSYSPSYSKMPIATSSLAPSGDRFAANLGVDSGQALSLGGANVSDNESSVVASRAAIWPIPGALLLFAIVLAGLNARRGRKTSPAVQGF